MQCCCLPDTGADGFPHASTNSGAPDAISDTSTCQLCNERVDDVGIVFHVVRLGLYDARAPHHNVCGARRACVPS